MFVFFCLLSVAGLPAVTGLSLLEKLKWPASAYVSIECDPGENYETCYSNCMSWGPNQTLQFLQEECYTKLPRNTPLTVSRHRTYFAQVNSTYMKSESWQIASMIGLKSALSLDFSADRPYIDRPDIVKRVYIRGVHLTYAAHQLQPFDVYIADGLEIPTGADGRFWLQTAADDDADYRTQCYVSHPEFPWVHKRKYDNARLANPFINITEAAVNLKREFPPVIILSGTFVIFEQVIDRNFARDLRFSIEITEEQSIKSDPVCTQIHSCTECQAAEGCGWCLLTNTSYACLEDCQHPWDVKECRTVRKKRLSAQS